MIDIKGSGRVAPGLQDFVTDCDRSAGARAKQKTAQASLKMYNSIINNSASTPLSGCENLELFKYYLNTGRAYGIQECMNILKKSGFGRK